MKKKNSRKITPFYGLLSDYLSESIFSFQELIVKLKYSEEQDSMTEQSLQHSTMICLPTEEFLENSETILNEQFKRKVISVDPANGKVREIELSLNCEISARDKDGKLVIPRQILRFRRDYYFDELSAEFTSDNRQVLENDLANDAAESIVLRLDVGGTK